MPEITRENAFDVYEQELKPAGILIDTRDATMVVLLGNICIGRFNSLDNAVRAASLYLRSHSNA